MDLDKWRDEGAEGRSSPFMPQNVPRAKNVLSQPQKLWWIGRPFAVCLGDTVSDARCNSDCALLDDTA